MINLKGTKKLTLVETKYEHIVLDEKNVPLIFGTKIKVIELVLEQIAYGWSPEELHFQHPHLTLGQIHSALAYYWDHKKELDDDIRKRLKFVDKLQKKSRSSPLKSRLKSNGLI